LRIRTSQTVQTEWAYLVEGTVVNSRSMGKCTTCSLSFSISTLPKMAKKNWYPIILRLLPFNREAPCSFRCCECCKIGAVVVIVIFVFSCPLLSRSVGRDSYAICSCRKVKVKSKEVFESDLQYSLVFSNYKQGLKYKSKGLGTFKVYEPFCLAYIFATIPSEN